MRGCERGGAAKAVDAPPPTDLVSRRQPAAMLACSGDILDIMSCAIFIISGLNILAGRPQPAARGRGSGGGPAGGWAVGGGGCSKGPCCQAVAAQRATQAVGIARWCISYLAWAIRGVGEDNLPS